MARIPAATVSALEGFVKSIDKSVLTHMGELVESKGGSPERYRWDVLYAKLSDGRSIWQAMREVDPAWPDYTDNHIDTALRSILGKGFNRHLSADWTPTVDASGYEADGADARAHGYGLDRNPYLWNDPARGAEPERNVITREAWARGWSNSPGELAYESERMEWPLHHDGSPRRPFTDLCAVVRDNWERHPTPRANPPYALKRQMTFTDNGR